MASVKIEYLAKIRDAMGYATEMIELPDCVRTGSDLVEWLSARNEQAATALADRASILFAIDDRIARCTDELGDAQTVTLFPPVTGG